MVAACPLKDGPPREGAAAGRTMFEHDADPVLVAHRLRVSTKSVYQWRRRWRAGGRAALTSKGSGGAVCLAKAGP